MQLVMLAAGRGTRFGGLKQIAPVGPEGEALMDLTVLAAEEAGFSGVVLVVREETRAAVLGHVAKAWPSTVPVEVVVQPPVAGTVPAVVAAKQALDGPFGVANADDLYDATVLGQLLEHFASKAGRNAATAPHALVSYQLVRTILTDEPVKRGLCVGAPDGTLADLVEHHIRLREDGRFDAWPLHASGEGERPRVLQGREPVSMNLWGFHPRVMASLEAVLDMGPTEAEVLLPEVLGALVRSGSERVELHHTASRCVGLTHREDVAALREQLCSPGILDGNRQ